MDKISFKVSNFNLPSPRWFRVLKKVVSWGTNLAIGLLMILYPDNTQMLLVIKLVQSSTMELFDSLMANGEVYSESEPPGSKGIAN